MASSPTSIKSVAIAVENVSFGSVASATGVSDHAALTFVTAAGIARADITTIGESISNTRDDEVRCAAYALAPEPATMYDHSKTPPERIRRRRGEITLTFNEIQLLGDGSGDIFDYAGHPLHMLVHSGMKLVSSSGMTTDTVVANIDNNTFTSTDLLGTYQTQVGGLFSTVINGRVEYSAITDATGNPLAAGDVTHAPAMSVGLSNEELRFAENFFSASDLSLDANSSVALRLDGVGFRTYAYGCRMTGLSASVSNDRLTLAVTLTCAYVTDDHANADVGCPAYPNGATQHLRGSYFVTGSDINSMSAAGAPFKTARTNTQVSSDSVSWSITNTYAPEGRSDDIVGMSDWALTDSAAEMTYTTTVPNTNIDDDFLNSSYRSALLGFAPQGQGNGLAFYIPSGFQTEDASKRDVSGELVSQTINLRAGPWLGDVEVVGTSNEHLVNSPFRLSFGL